MYSLLGAKCESYNIFPKFCNVTLFDTDHLCKKIARPSILVIPGLGLVIAGHIAAGLAGVGSGGITGGVIGALVGSGIPEARAKLYESGIKEGQIVIGVHPRNEEDARYLENNWRTKKGEEIHG